MKIKRCICNALAVGMATTALTNISIAAQEQDAEVSVFEEIMVTARKRSEGLQDVPASIAAFSGPSMQQRGLPDLGSLAPAVPNFSYASAPGASDILIIRGLGTVGSGPHFEPAVGQVFNGFFASRSRLGRAAFIDVGQLEIPAWSSGRHHW